MKDQRIAIRFTEKEKEEIDNFAEKKGFSSTSSFVRKCIYVIMGKEKFGNNSTSSGSDLSEITEKISKLEKMISLQTEIIESIQRQQSLEITKETEIEFTPEDIEIVQKIIRDDKNYQRNGSPVIMDKIIKKFKDAKETQEKRKITGREEDDLVATVNDVLLESGLFKNLGRGWVLNE